MTLVLPAYNKLIGGFRPFEVIDLGGASGTTATLTKSSVSVPSGYDVYVLFNTTRTPTSVTVGSDSAVEIANTGDFYLYAVSGAAGGTVNITANLNFSGDIDMIAMAVSDSFGDAESPTATNFGGNTGSSVANAGGREFAVFGAVNEDAAVPVISGATEVFTRGPSGVNFGMALGYEYPAGNPAAFTATTADVTMAVLI